MIKGEIRIAVELFLRTPKSCQMSALLICLYTF